MGLFALPFGIVRTLVAVIKRFVFKGKQPLRIDLPFPFVPIDIVFMMDPEQIKLTNHSPHVDHLHRVDNKHLPRWVQWYFSGTHFHNGPRGKWFLAFESLSCPNYAERRAAHDRWLAPEFTDEDVKRVATLVRANADEDTIADAVAQMVIGRALLKKEIPAAIVKMARGFLSAQITDALVPGHYARSKKAQEEIYEWCAANGTPPGLQTIDVVHTFGAVSNKFAHAITVLKDNLGTPADVLFTRAANCPTPNTPRIFFGRSTLDGLLAYPSVPQKTVLLYNIAKAAEATNDLFFTLGAGEPGNRVCAFKNYFVHFMQALQKELKSPASGLSLTK